MKTVFKYLQSPPKRLVKYLTLNTIGLVGLILSVNASAATADRWFEMEMIIFSRDDTTTTTEFFPEHIQPIKVNRARNLLAQQFPSSAKSFIHLLPKCKKTLPTVNLAPQYHFDIEASEQQFNNILADVNRKQVYVAGRNGLRLEETQVNHPIVIDKKPTDLSKLITLFDKPAWQETDPLSCVPEQPLALFNQDQDPYAIYWDKTPIRLAVLEDIYQKSPYLLNSRSLKFKKEVQKLMWREDIQPLLHFGWRQAIKSKKREKPWRIFAGKNFSKEFDYYGDSLIKPSLIEESEDTASIANKQMLVEDQSLNHHDVMANINSVVNKLDSGEWQAETAQQQMYSERWQQQEKINGTPKNVWQIDGLFKIYLQHYLFIEAEFNLREVGKHPIKIQQEKIQALLAEQNAENSPSDVLTSPNLTTGLNLTTANKDEYLYAYHFKQNRRLRSTEIHYFDHPKMGIVLQVRKYTPPEEDENQ